MFEKTKPNFLTGIEKLVKTCYIKNEKLKKVGGGREKQNEGSEKYWIMHMFFGEHFGGSGLTLMTL